MFRQNFWTYVSKVGLLVRISLPLVILFVLFRLIQTIRFIKGRTRWNSLNLKNTKTSPLTYVIILTIALIIMIPLLSMKSGMFYLISMLIGGGFMIVIFRLLQKQRWSRFKKFTVYILSGFVITWLIMTLSVVSLFSDSIVLNNQDKSNPLLLTSLTDQGCELSIDSESVLAHYQFVSCDEAQYEYYVMKMNVLNESISDQFVKDQYFEPNDVEYNQIKSKGNMHIYRSERFGVSGYQEIPQELIDELIQLTQ